MRAFIDKMFDFDLEVAEIEKEIFSIPSKMETIFNCIDLSSYSLLLLMKPLLWWLDIRMICASITAENLV